MSCPSLVRKFICFDLETTFIQRGCKRGDAKILELALKSENLSYVSLVNPLEKYGNGEEVMESLNTLNQHVENTLNFWTKLLIGKRALRSNLKRKDPKEKASAISELLKRSDMAKLHENPNGMMQALARNSDNVEKAKGDIRKHDKSFRSLFHTADEAIKGALKEAKGIDVWCAHNGKAFDEKVLRGHQNHDFQHITFVDSLYILRELIPGLKSYSQPLVYEHLFNKSYFAHHAMEDATALLKIMNHALDEKCIVETYLKVRKKKMKFGGKKKPRLHGDSNLYSLKGIGPVSVERLFKKDITTKEQLLAIMSSTGYENWCEKFSFIHRHRKFYETHALDDNSAFV